MIVDTAKLVMDETTRRPKGFGFVTFKSEDEARNALKAMNGRVLSLASFYSVSITYIEE